MDNNNKTKNSSFMDEHLRREEIRLKKNESRRRVNESIRKREENELRLMAENKLLPDFLTLRQIAILLGHIPSAFECVIEKTGLEIEERDFEYQGSFFKEKGTTSSAYKRYLQSQKQWPINGLLANWWKESGSDPKDESGVNFGAGNQSIKPRKKLIPIERNTTESLLLIYAITTFYKVNYQDELPGPKAWGKIVSGEFKDDLITSVSDAKKSITLNGGEKLTNTNFYDKYRKRFKETA